MERTEEPRSLSDLDVIVGSRRRRAVYYAVISSLLFVLSVVMWIFASLDAPRFLVFFLLSLLMLMTLLISLGWVYAWVIVYPFTFSEKLKFALNSLYTDLKTYVKCTGPEARKTQSRKVKKHLITVAAIVIDGMEMTEDKLDIMTEDLRLFLGMLMGFLEGINYRIKKLQPISPRVATSLTNLVSGLESYEHWGGTLKTFKAETDWLSGQGEDLRDPEFMTLLGPMLRRIGDRFYQKREVEVKTVLGIIIFGVLYAISVSFLLRNIDSNTLFMGFVIVESAVGGGLYAGLKARR